MKTLEQQLAEAQSLLDSIKLQIENKQKYPQDGTICEVWNNNSVSGKALAYAYAYGSGYFRMFKGAGPAVDFDNFKPLEMGLTFSDEIIHSKDITSEMDKQLALCWNEDGIAYKSIRVIDYKTKSTFRCTGERDGYPFGNYQLCTTPIGNLPQWARDMIDACDTKEIEWLERK
jgi:hypothetical protein